MKFLQPFLALPPDPGKPAPDNSLLFLAHEGRVVVPRFQRDYEWKPDFATSLLASIARNWPSGQLLLMSGDRGFPSRTLRGVDEDVGAVTYSVLDGQQRLTALYRAYFNTDSKRVFFFRIGDFATSGVITDDSFGHVTRGTWKRICPDYEHQADPSKRQTPVGRPTRPVLDLVAEGRVVTLDAYLDGNHFESWLKHIPAREREEYRSARQSLAARLTAYQFPVTLIDGDDDDDTLTSLFVTVNLRQQILGTFDLVVAKSWLRDSFDLREKWFNAVGRTQEGESGAEAERPALRDFRIDPETLLRLLALIAGADATSKTNLVALAPDVVRANTDKALKALDTTLRFLEARAGVIPESLPTQTGLLPIARVLVEKPALTKNEASAERLLQWFWTSTFGQRYGRGQTNTLVVKDAEELSAWLGGGKDTPEVITNFSPKRGDLFEDVTGNEIILAGVFSLENLSGARDWMQGTLISESGRRPRHGGAEPSSIVSRHHVFPQDMNDDKFRESRTAESPLPWDEPSFDPREIVANRALLLVSTNSEVSSHSPSSVEDIKGVVPEYLTTYLMKWDGDREYEPFIVARANRISARLIEVLGQNGLDVEVPDLADLLVDEA
jgi:hypothetical protein